VRYIHKGGRIFGIEGEFDYKGTGYSFTVKRYVKLTKNNLPGYIKVKRKSTSWSGEHAKQLMRVFMIILDLFEECFL